MIERVAYKAADKIIFTSNKDKQFAQGKFNIASSKIELIPNYTDTELFKPLIELRTSSFNPQKSASVIFIGRFSSEKNLFNLVEAAVDLPIKIVLVGAGPLKNDLAEFAKTKTVTLEFKGSIPNERLSEELNKAEIFILPSFYEGCPKTLLEAMACGLPCIGADVEGIKEIIDHKENGYLCGTESVSIRKGIIEVLENKEMQEKMALNARRTILERFSLPKILEKEIDVYQSL